MPNTSLPREEWDFSRDFCKGISDERWPLFLAYEYGREVDCFRQAYERDKAGGWNFDQNGNWATSFYRDEDDGMGGYDRTEVYINAPPGFPSVPYIHTNHVLDDESFLQPLAPLKEVHFTGTGFVDARGWELDDLKSAYSFEIDLDVPDRLQLAAFRAWLDLKRRTHPPKREYKEVRVIESQLKALGVLRLVRHFDSVPRAIAYTTEHGWTGGYFQNEESWSRQATKAQALIDLWSKLTAI